MNNNSNSIQNPPKNNNNNSNNANQQEVTTHRTSTSPCSKCCTRGASRRSHGWSQRPPRITLFPSARRWPPERQPMPEQQRQRWHWRWCPGAAFGRSWAWTSPRSRTWRKCLRCERREIIHTLLRDGEEFSFSFSFSLSLTLSSWDNII